MLKISPVGPVNHSVTLHLEGRIVGPWVAELRKSCEEVLEGGQSLKLVLAEVEFLDANGVSLLSSLRSRGVTLQGCSPFVEAQLKLSDGS